MGENDGPIIRLSNGRSYPYQDMEKLVKLMGKHASLLDSADPDKARMGFVKVNDEGKECSWHVQDKCLQVAEELSTMWIRLKDYAKSINVESLDEEEEDGGMDHKLHDQIVEYLKTGRIPYENYSAERSKCKVSRDWQNKCAPYSLADDGLTLHKGRAVVLKKGEVMKAIAIYHHICGHSNSKQMCVFFGQLFEPRCYAIVSSYVTSCSCGKMADVNCKDLAVSVKNTGGGRRNIVISSGQESCGMLEISKKGLKTKISYCFTETEYEKELMRARSSSSSKFQVARDGKSLITSSGAIVLKDEEAINVFMRIHELCGHLNRVELQSFGSRFIFVTGCRNLSSAVVNKCHFCRCRAKLPVLSPSPINVQNVSLDIKVHYDEGANERRFQIITHGVDPKVVEHYVETSIDTLKSYGKWKEPVFSPEAALARSVLRVVDLLKEEEEEMENVVDFDPLHNDILSDEIHVNDTMDEERGSESEIGSVTESLVEVPISEEEEEEVEDEENVEDEEDESDVEDEELREMRRLCEERERQAEAMENETRRLDDATGRMRAYIRQWEFSDYLHELIRLEENSRLNRMENEDEEEEREDEKSGESEEEAEMRENDEGKVFDKENNTALCDETPSSSGMGVLTEEENKLKARKKKRGGRKKNKKGKGELEKPPYDLTPYKANYEEKGDAVPDVSNTVQMERVEMELRDRKALFPPPPLTRDGHPVRKRERLAQLRREKDELERMTKKEEVKKVQPIYNPYAAIFNGNMWPAEDMEKRRRMREERERRKEAGLTESEEDEEEYEE